MSCGTKMSYIFIQPLLLEKRKYRGLTVVCENLLGRQVGGSISKPSPWGLLLTDSSTILQEIGREPQWKVNFEMLADGAGIALLK